MAGSDHAGVAWAGAYDPIAGEVVSALTDWTNACYQVAALLQATGFNYAMAEAASDPSRLTAMPVDTHDYASATSTYVAQVPPSAAGGSGGGPPGWGLIASAVGYVWPNGHQDRLRSTAAAWRTVADAVIPCLDGLGEAYAAVSQETCPEAPDAQLVIADMAGHLREIVVCCHSLSDACDEYAGYIDQVHSEIEHACAELVAETAALETAGGLFGFFTFGGSIAAAQAAVAARVATMAGRVGGMIAKFVSLVEGIAGKIAELAARIATVASRMKQLASAKITEAITAVVDSLPRIAGLEPALAGMPTATGRLVMAAERAKTTAGAVKVARAGEAGVAADKTTEVVKDAENARHAGEAGADAFPELEEAAAKLPSEWGMGRPNDKGVGRRWQDPKHKGNGVRIDQGDPNSPFPSQRVDHVIVRYEGTVRGPDGQPIPGSITENYEAHIPLKDWLTWTTWYAP